VGRKGVNKSDMVTMSARNKGKTPVGVTKLPPDYKRAVIATMTIMRFQGKTSQECDAWLENFIQQIERIERESANG
jgi:flavoprotein